MISDKVPLTPAISRGERGLMSRDFAGLKGKMRWEHVPPVWQLRVEDWRVFYDVDERARQVIVRAVRRKGKILTEEIL